MEGGSSPLSEAERRRLRSIEDDLARDRVLAAVFEEAGAPSDSATGSPVVDVDRALGAGIVLGSAAIGLGLVWEIPLLGLVGFATTVAATDRIVARHEFAARAIARWWRSRDDEKDGESGP